MFFSQSVKLWLSRSGDVNRKFSRLNYPDNKNTVYPAFDNPAIKNRLRVSFINMNTPGTKKPFLQHLARTLSILARHRKLVRLIRSLHPVCSEVPLIRLGPRGDGGYLVPNDLDSVVACFSPGVCNTSGFEMDCAARGIRVYMADASVNGPASQNPSFHFLKRFIGAQTTGEFIRLDDWIEQSIGQESGDLILQMDIEGHEYEVFHSVSNYLLERFRIMVIEFHGLHGLLNGSRQPYASMQETFRKILRTHRCVHIHPNNTASVRNTLGIHIPDLLEMTFLRRDRVFLDQYASTFPHPLDCDNDSTLPTITLPGSWYVK